MPNIFYNLPRVRCSGNKDNSIEPEKNKLYQCKDGIQRLVIDIIYVDRAKTRRTILTKFISEGFTENRYYPYSVFKRMIAWEIKEDK